MFVFFQIVNACYLLNYSYYSYLFFIVVFSYLTTIIVKLCFNHTFTQKLGTRV